MDPVLILLLVIVVFFILSNLFKERIDWVTASQHYTFEEMKFSTKEFYALTENLIKDKEIPSVQLSRVSHLSGNYFSAKREYLRVVYGEFFFDICAAPFARDFFVSWRQGNLKKIAIGKKRYKTFYEEDTELMFKESVKLCVNRAIKQITEQQGIRWQPEVESLVEN